MPATKPDLFIDDEGVCSACRYIERRQEIDWDQRKEELRAVLARHRSLSGENYDCIVPVAAARTARTRR